MNLLMTDLPLALGEPLPEDTHVVDLNQCSIRPCVGCFGCWVKTPGRCVIRDDATTIYPRIAHSRRLLYVTRVWCGCYDIPMKTMLERAIPVQQAFIRLHHGETHHVQRSVVEKEAVFVAYGAERPEEQALFRRLVERNTHNMLISRFDIRFVAREQVQTAVEEVLKQWNKD